MKKIRILLPLLALAVCLGGCDRFEPTGVGEDIELKAQFATFANGGDVVIIGGTTLNTYVDGAGVVRCGTGGSPTTDANTFSWTGGGCLPVVGGGVADFNFSPLPHTGVTRNELANYDMAVLNLGSYQMRCNTGLFTADQKNAMVEFVASGKKLIIYDSE